MADYGVETDAMTLTRFVITEQRKVENSAKWNVCKKNTFSVP